MRRNPRKRVVRFDLRPNTGPSRDLFAECATAVLECGHLVNLGVCADYKPSVMACQECGAAGHSREVGRKAVG